MSYGVMTRRGFVGLGAAAPLLSRRLQRIPDGRIMPRYRVHARRGMGVLNYYDLLNQANLQNCDPRDSACVADNVAKQAAVEDFWVQHMATGVPNDTQLSFTPLTPSQVTNFADPGSFNIGNVVPTGIMQVSSPHLGPAQIPPSPILGVQAPPIKVANHGGSSPAPGTQGGAKVITSSGVTQPLLVPQEAPSPFSWSGTLGGIPAWGWALAAGGALFAFGGARGRG